MSAGSLCGRASTLLTTGIRGERILTAAIALLKCATAGSIIGVWKAPATSSRTHFIAPAASAASASRWQASADPETTQLPGHRTLANASTSPPRTWSHNVWIDSRSNPNTASIVPGRSSAHSCMARPRTSTSRTASSKSMEPANTSAVYSPSDKPAAIDTLPSGLSARPLSTSSMARLVTKIAGWLMAVVLRWSTGPFLQMAARS